jgi:predicted GNAT family acetyltransferase
MTGALTDTTGAGVTVGIELSDPVSAYTITVDDGPVAGRAEFVDLPNADRERIIFHTEVDQDFAGRGLAKILLAEVLADSIRQASRSCPCARCSAATWPGTATSSSPRGARSARRRARTCPRWPSPSGAGRDRPRVLQDAVLPHSVTSDDARDRAATEVSTCSR